MQRERESERERDVIYLQIEESSTDVLAAQKTCQWPKPI